MKLNYKKSFNLVFLILTSCLFLQQNALAQNVLENSFESLEENITLFKKMIAHSPELDALVQESLKEHEKEQIDDLSAEELAIVCTKLILHLETIENFPKAPRPGILAPAGENEIVGPGACDLSAVINLLHQILTALNKCCAILQRDFRETWTILAEITNELQGTFTVLADLKATISSDFNQTWTILDDIKSTITECCANITREFQETWTILDAGFNGTFSVLVDINATISSDFNQTWTILSDIKDTITSCCEKVNTFNGTFTVLTEIINTLTECCENITREFHETWTILDDIKSTITECCANITIEFQETWTIINAGFNGTFTAIEEINIDAAGTFSVLADINNSLTICCENITREFQETWTILTDINNTITTCCENITREFQETWTILSAGFNGTFSSLVENAFTYSVITDLKATLSTDINQTWTILTDIKNTITACCRNITLEFQGTWTILNEINNKLDDLLSCACGKLFPITDSNDLLKSTDIIFLHESMNINKSGSYYLAHPIIGDISIQENNITLDLNKNVLTGNIILENVENIIIKNGTISNNTIKSFSTIKNIIIEDIVIKDCESDFGIVFNKNVKDLTIKNLTIQDCKGGISISSDTKNNRISINNFTISRCNMPAIEMSSCKKGLLKNGTITYVNGNNAVVLNECKSIMMDTINIRNVMSTNTTSALQLNMCFDCEIQSCKVSKISGNNSAIGFDINHGSKNITFKGCKAYKIISKNEAYGFIINDPNTSMLELHNCKTQNIQGNTSCGYSQKGSNILYNACSISNCIGDKYSNGFLIEGNNIIMTDCLAMNCSNTQEIAGAGYTIHEKSMNVSLQNCQSHLNNNGFQLDTPHVVAYHCSAFNNTASGFKKTEEGIKMYDCFETYNK